MSHECVICCDRDAARRAAASAAARNTAMASSCPVSSPHTLTAQRYLRADATEIAARRDQRTQSSPATRARMTRGDLVDRRASRRRTRNRSGSAAASAR